MKQEYPKYLYHPELPAQLVHDVDAHAELGEEWRESPAEFVDVEEIPGGVVSSEPAAAAKPAKAAKKAKK
jgi:hypothetical protein